MSKIHATIKDRGPFTDKESEVLRCMCEGLYTTEIAIRQCRSPRTIGKHIENIAQKLGAHGSSEIVLIARELGFIEITVTETPHLLKIVLLIILCNTFFPQKDMRRPPKVRTSSVRLIRLHRQH